MSKNATNYFSQADFKYQESDELVKIAGWDYPLQIISGAIDPTVHGDLDDLQVITAKGTWDLHALLKSDVGEDEMKEFLEDRKRRDRIQPVRWSMRSEPFVIPTNVANAPVAVELSANFQHDVAEKNEIVEDWRSSPSEILAKLEDPSIGRADLFDAVLFAEVAKFNESQTAQLVTRLFAFVKEFRLSQVEDAKTAVGAAIRKLAMNLQDSQIEEYADLLLPTDTETLPCEIELELAKAILWRLTASPASLAHEYSKLESRLAELALDYLKPRLILQKNYASVALQAALGALVLNGQHTESVLKRVNELGIGWFTDLFLGRLKRLRKQFQEIADEPSNAVATNLAEFELGFNVPCTKATQ